MTSRCQVGDLVHIPQAVELIDCDQAITDDPQLTIPLRVEVTQGPKVGVITEVSSAGSYTRVLCDGAFWAVRNDHLYPIEQ
tara:strand:+ start:1319 stop:1561 length:243 start_codon:yes stop_codon:yes gene_type:complete